MTAIYQGHSYVLKGDSPVEDITVLALESVFDDNKNVKVLMYVQGVPWEGNVLYANPGRLEPLPCNYLHGTVYPNQ